MSGARWYRAACTAHFRGDSAGFVMRSDGAGLGAAERFAIAATEARLEAIEELGAAPAFDADEAGTLGASFRSRGVLVWIRAADDTGTSWLETRAETLWIADWEVIDSVRDDGRIAGRLRGTAFLEVRDETQTPDVPAPVPAHPPVSDVAAPGAISAPLPQHTVPYVPPTPGAWDAAPDAPVARSGAADPWRAMEGVDFGFGRAGAGRHSGCTWLGGGAGLGALLLGGCCLIGPIFQAIAGIGVGGGTLLGGVVAVLVALALSALAWRLWRRDTTATRSGCGPRVLALLVLLWLLGGCLVAALIGTSWFGRGVPRVAAPFLGGLDLGCWQTGIGYRDRAGERIRVTCPGVCTLHRVWGTDVYSDDSSICAAAQHAGLLTGARKTVTLRVREGRDTYVGSSRNGVESSAWGRWGGSFSFCDGPTPETQCDDAGPNSAVDSGSGSEAASDAAASPSRERRRPRRREGRRRERGDEPSAATNTPSSSEEDARRGEPPTSADDAPADTRDAPLPEDAPGDGKRRRASIALSVSVEPRAEGGSSWDIANGLPDLSLCVTTDARRCVPAERDDAPDASLPCRDTLRCQARVPIDPASRRIRVEVIDRDVTIHDLVGAGDCDFGRVCRVGRARLTVGMPEQRDAR